MIGEVISVLFVLLFLVKLYKDAYKRPNDNFPPGPPKLPIWGSYFVITFKEVNNLAGAMRKYAAEYKTKVVGMYLGIYPSVVADDPELIKEVLNREVFDGRLDIVIARLRSYWKRLGIFFTDDYFWHVQRRFSLRYMRDFGFGRRDESLEAVIDHEIKEMLDIITTGPKYPAEKELVKGDLVTLPYIFAVPFLNGLLHVFSRMTVPRPDYHVLWQLSRKGTLFQSGSNDFGGALTLTPWLKDLLPKWSGYSALRIGNEGIRSFMVKLVEEAVATYEESHDRHFLDVYIRKMKEEMKTKNRTTFSVDQLVMMLVDYSFPAATAVEQTLSFLIERILLQPEIQNKIHEEIDRVVGRDRRPNLNDRSNCHVSVYYLMGPKASKLNRINVRDLSEIASFIYEYCKASRGPMGAGSLPYTEACLREIMRFETLVPLGVPHRATEDTELGGYNIPQNTFVAVNYVSLHKDERLWGDPENFRPERFIVDGKLQVSTDKSLPFGAGRRLCAGETYARQTMFQVFAAFMQAFHISTADGIPLKKPAKRIQGIIMLMPNFWIRVTPRT